MAGKLAEIGDESGIERLDGDRIMAHTQDIGGAPADIFKSDARLLEDRLQKLASVQHRQLLDNIEQTADAAKAAGEGVMALEDAAAMADAGNHSHNV